MLKPDREGCGMREEFRAPAKPAKEVAVLYDGARRPSHPGFADLQWSRSQCGERRAPFAPSRRTYRYCRGTAQRYLVVGCLIPEGAVVLRCDERCGRGLAGIRWLQQHQRMLAPAVKCPRWRLGRRRVACASKVRPLRQQLILQCCLVGVQLRGGKCGLANTAAIAVHSACMVQPGSG
jgi:hypothetical protein